jgi:hypothetical protein
MVDLEHVRYQFWGESGFSNVRVFGVIWGYVDLIPRCVGQSASPSLQLVSLQRGHEV